MKFKKIISKLFTVVFSLPKTVYFNFKALPIKQAVKLPVFVSYKVNLIEVKKGILEFPNGISFFLVRIGAGGSPSLPSQQSSIRMGGGKLSFLGKARMGEGTIINIKGKMIIGKCFSTNKNCLLSCTNKVVIGDDVLFGWDCHVFDDNGGHRVLYNGVERKHSNEENAIIIGNHVWICSYAHLLAGSGIGNGSILGYKSLLTKNYNEENVLIVGSPAKIKENNVKWSV